MVSLVFLSSFQKAFKTALGLMDKILHAPVGMIRNTAIDVILCDIQTSKYMSYLSWLTGFCPSTTYTAVLSPESLHLEFRFL